MRLQQPPKSVDPFVGVLAGFAQPYRDVVFVPKGKILLDCLLIYRRSILVKGIDELPIKGRSKNFEVAVPLRAAEKDDVIAVHLPYSGYYLAVERLQLRV